MKASELIELLQAKIIIHGDLEVMVSKDDSDLSSNDAVVSAQAVTTWFGDDDKPTHFHVLSHWEAAELGCFDKQE